MQVLKVVKTVDNKPFKLGVLVGRFQTLHSGHEMMIEKAVELCENVGLFVGSSQESRTFKNPFSFSERKEMLISLFGEKVCVYPLPDIGVGNTSKWGDYVLENAFDRFGMLPDLLISGRESRRIDWLKGEKGRGISELYIPKTIEISATDMRQYFIDNDIEAFKKYTNEKLWSRYDEMREIILSSKENLETKSI